jgi:3',5'-cyclic AMP phosphodiesterase CpdA
MDPFFFMQLADPQFGMFARWGGVSDDVIETGLFRGFKIRKAPAIAFSHHPAFLKTPDEPDDYWNWPLERRKTLLELLRNAGAKAVFAGHWHRNNYSSYDDMQVVASGPVGYPLGDDPSGYRIVKVHADRVQHDYYAFGDGPGSVEL